MHITKISRQNIWSIIRWHKRYFFGVIILLAFVVRGFFTISSTEQEITESESYTVRSGNIENTIKVLGTTSITNQQTLTFQAAGSNGSVSKVTKLYVKEWDTVKAGQLLAEIDKKDLQIQLSQQSLSIQNSRINYDKLLNQYDESDFIQAQKNIDDTQLKLDIAKNNLVTLQSEQGDMVQVGSVKIQSIINTTQNIVNDGEDMLKTIDEIFYITKSNIRYATVQIYISAKNSSYKNSTERNYYAAKNVLATLKNDLSLVKWQSSTTLTSIQDLSAKSKEFLTALYTVADSATNAVNNSVDGEVLPLSTIQSWASTLWGYRSKSLTYQNTVTSNITDLSNTNDDILSKKSEIKGYENQLQIYKNTLQDMQNGPDAQDKQLQSNSISQSSLSYQKLSQTKSNYEITAPFDGNIDAIDFKQWDNVDSTQWITISNPDIYEVSMLIDQVDIVKIDKWQEAEIVFDAYPWYSVTGQITTIDPTPVTSAGVVSYYVKIALEKAEKRMYDGMTVTVNITIEKKDDVLVVPTTAIQTIRENTTVLVNNSGTVVPTPVEVWITDGIQSEIISGLYLGDVISLTSYITSAATSSQDSEMASMQSMRALEWWASGWPSWFPGN